MIPKLPEPVDRNSSPVCLEDPGTWLVLADTHIPFHDRRTIELAIGLAKKEKVNGVLLNGDILDSHELSDFDKTPNDPRYPDEIQKGREFLEYLRYQLPKVRFVFRDGNHEERLFRYLCRRAPALFGLDVLTLPSLLHFDEFGVEYVTDKRVIRLGRLNVIHGHEYRPAVQVPVNPARGIFLRAQSVVLVGHWHQTSEHHQPTIAGKPQGAWSTGCACGLAPLYSPLNKWNNGFAIVRIWGDGDFAVRNMRVIDGKIV